MGGFSLMTEFNCINIINRKEIAIKGVKDIISYESDRIAFAIDETELVITGSNFNIKKIDVDNKIAEISGYFVSLLFADENVRKSNRSFLSNLFR